MKKIILLFFTIFLQFLSHGQAEFSPPGAEWHFRMSGILNGSYQVGVSHVQYANDTLIAGKNCKKLIQTSIAETYYHTQNYYIYQSNDSIFIVNHFQSGLSFDFQFINEMKVGDTLYFPNLFYLNKLKVDSIDILALNNIETKRFKLTELGSPPTFSTYIYDKFGPEFTFFQDWTSSWFDGIYYWLRCYADNEFPQYNLTNITCYGDFSETKELDKGIFINAFPNPTPDVLNLNLPFEFQNGYSLILSDASGKTILEEYRKGHYNATLETNTLEAGFYIGVIKKGSKSFIFKFVKI